MIRSRTKYRHFMGNDGEGRERGVSRARGQGVGKGSHNGAISGSWGMGEGCAFTSCGQGYGAGHGTYESSNAYGVVRLEEIG